MTAHGLHWPLRSRPGVRDGRPNSYPRRILLMSACDHSIGPPWRGPTPPRIGCFIRLRDPRGGVPEWLKGTGCKPVDSVYVGSNPTSAIEQNFQITSPVTGRRIRRTISRLCDLELRSERPRPNGKSPTRKRAGSAVSATSGNRRGHPGEFRTSFSLLRGALGLRGGP